MLTTKSMLQTIKTNKNSRIAIPLRVSKKKKTVIFRNSCEAELSLPENKLRLEFLRAQGSK
jgi:hypothetical protein